MTPYRCSLCYTVAIATEEEEAARMETVEGVYADQLAEAFRWHTGLDTHL